MESPLPSRIAAAFTNLSLSEPSQRLPVRHDFPSIFSRLLRICRDDLALSDGRRLHNIVVICGSEHPSFIQNLLVQMYGTCRALDDAREILNGMIARDMSSWTFIIRAYAEEGHAKDAFSLFEYMKREESSMFLSWADKDAFLYNAKIALLGENGLHSSAIQQYHRMQLEACLPDKVTLITILCCCANQKSGSDGKQIHSNVVGSRFKEDINVCNSILCMYAKSGELSSAREMFKKMININVISCNTMISCFIKNMNFDQAFLIFQQMWQQEIEPSDITFATVFAGCAEQKAIMLGRTLHACILELGLISNPRVNNAIMSMYGKCGSLHDAWKVFHVMTQRDMVSWTTIITAYATNDQGWIAFELLNMMHSIMDLDNGAFISIVSALTNSSQIYNNCVEKEPQFCEGARNVAFDILMLVQRIFDSIEKKDAVTWNVIITAHAQMGYVRSALQLFAKLLEETVLPDPHICTSVLSLCGNCGALLEGMRMHSLAVENDIEIDTTMGNALLSLYGKCGCLEDTDKLFGSILRHDVVTWTVIIEVYALNGKGQVALELYQQMLSEGVFPDRIIFLSILSACSSYTNLLQGIQIHNHAVANFGTIDLVIGNGLINMHAKCGNLWMARKSFDSVPNKVVSSWNAMISGYAQNGLYEDALALFWLMQQESISPNTITLVSVLSACTHGGMVYEACYLFASMHLDHKVWPELEHYNSMLDMLGKAGQLDLAEYLIRNMACQPTTISWMSFLSACKYQLDFQWAIRSFWFALELDCSNLAPYVVLVNMEYCEL